MLLLLMTSSENIKGQNCDRAKDSLELVKFYEATNGNNWKNKWNLHAPMENWFGVFIGTGGCVVGLDLSQNNGNNLSGTLPALEIEHLINLQLADNNISGQLPSFEGLPNLKVLTLSSNSFTGTLENLSVLSNLERMDLSRNNFTGDISWISGMTNLRNINISKNKLIDNLNDFNLLPNLVFLNISDNLFSGTFPSFPAASNLEFIDASYNLITGILPGLGNSPLLETLILNNNLIEGLNSNFYFSFPVLSQLMLSNNHIEYVSPNIGYMTGLMILDLRNNRINQLQEIRQPDNLKTLLISDNYLTFSGIIPNLNKAEESTLYSPQKSFGTDQNVTGQIGNSITIGFDVDNGVTGNNYYWYKDSEYLTQTPTPYLTLSNLTINDAGIYKLQVNNFNAPLLTLNSKEIRLNIETSLINDFCLGAIEIFDIFGGCHDYTINNATLDLVTPTCYNTNPVNIWYKFRAYGPEIHIIISNNTGNMDISLIRFSNNVCTFGGLTELACSNTQTLFYNGLIPGQDYYIMVTKGTNPFSTFSLCVNNFIPPPSNDEICEAVTINPWGCIDGTTVGATEDYGGTLCTELGKSTVWYKLKIPAGTNSVELDISDNNFRGPVNITFFNDVYCAIPPSIAQSNVYCGEVNNSLYFTNLTPEAYYYILISTSFEGSGNFRLCNYPLLLSDSDCNTQHSCMEASLIHNIINLSADEKEYCITNCNVLGRPGNTLVDENSCEYLENYTKWYHVIVDSESNLLSVGYTVSDDITVPRLQLLSSTDCSNFELITCRDTLFENGKIEFLYSVTPGQRLYIAISDDERAFGSLGEFELCLRSLSRPNRCVLDSDLYVRNTSLGSSSSGPFIPGEEIEFCFEIKEWFKYDCSNLQGIVPVFGQGWDTSSFTIVGEPKITTTGLTSHKQGRWVWVERNTIFYNATVLPNSDYGVFPGQPLRAGWFFQEWDSANSEYKPFQESYGDGFGCDQDTLTWKVCFTLKAKEFGQCESLPSGSVSVNIMTFSDAEIGANTGSGCYTDVRSSFSASISCCKLENIPDQAFATICNGDNLILDLNDLLGTDLNYRWIPIETDSIIGAIAGFGSILNARYSIVKGNGDVNQRYKVLSVDNLGCSTNVCELNVIVTHYPEIGIFTNGEYCANEDVPFEFLGYIEDTAITILYSVNDTEDSFILNNNSVINIPAGDAGTFKFISASSEFCTSYNYLDRIFHETKPLSYSVHDVLYCKNDTVIFNGTEYFEEGIHTDTLTGGGINGCDSIVTINVYEKIFEDGVLVIREFCHGGIYEFNNKIYDKTGVFYDTITVQESCDIINTLNLRFYDPIILAGTIISHDDGTGNGALSVNIQGGKPPYTYLWSTGHTTHGINDLDSGHYYVVVTDALGCTNTFEFQILLTGITENIKGLSNVSIYPNPVYGNREITVKMNTLFSEDMEIALLTGSNMIMNVFYITTIAGENKFIFNLDHQIPTGIYFLQFKNKHGGIFVKSILVK